MYNVSNETPYRKFKKNIIISYLSAKPNCLTPRPNYLVKNTTKLAMEYPLFHAQFPPKKYEVINIVDRCFTERGKSIRDDLWKIALLYLNCNGFKLNLGIFNMPCSTADDPKLRKIVHSEFSVCILERKSYIRLLYNAMLCGRPTYEWSATILTEFNGVDVKVSVFMNEGLMFVTQGRKAQALLPDI